MQFGSVSCPYYMFQCPLPMSSTLDQALNLCRQISDKSGEITSLIIQLSSEIWDGSESLSPLEEISKNLHLQRDIQEGASEKEFVGKCKNEDRQEVTIVHVVCNKFNRITIVKGVGTFWSKEIYCQCLTPFIFLVTTVITKLLGGDYMKQRSAKVDSQL
ncbi:Uncharacterized protein Rs2_05734 [Raphanus sativus]|nr:Uncharacterized protein Rs2_05734 [Raphanus sativus]